MVPVLFPPHGLLGFEIYIEQKQGQGEIKPDQVREKAVLQRSREGDESRRTMPSAREKEKKQNEKQKSLCIFFFFTRVWSNRVLPGAVSKYGIYILSPNNVTCLLFSLNVG